MARRNGLIFLVILIVFVLTLLIVIPISKGTLGGKGMRLGLDLVGGVQLVYKVKPSENATLASTDLDRAVTIIEKRIDTFGVTEPVIQKVGSDRIMVQLPGFTDIDAAKQLVDQTGFLEFREAEKNTAGQVVYLKDYLNSPLTTFFDTKESAPRLFVNEDGQGKDYGKFIAYLSSENGSLKFTDMNGNAVDNTTLQEYLNEAAWIPARGTDGTELTGTLLADAQPTLGGNLGSEPEVSIKWNAKGSEIFDQIALRLYNPSTTYSLDHVLAIILDGTLISAPQIRAQSFTGQGVIAGSFTVKTSTELANLLRSGALPVQLEKPPEYQNKISATLGKNFIDKSWKAGLIGIALVMLFMIVYYRLPGLLASIALVFYASLTMTILKLWPAPQITLTLAGLGGFIASIGMAVDANVLIFERMKEEFRMGRTLGAAIEAGFNRAWSAIRDSNLTTFIACLILAIIGSNIVAGTPLKWFGITLFIGVAVSMFTAIFVTRTLLRLFINSSLASKPWLFTAGGGKK